MSHPNVDLAAELDKCIRATDVDSVELTAVSGKRKGYLLLSQDTGRYVLTPKGVDFFKKWGRAPARQTQKTPHVQTKAKA